MEDFSGGQWGVPPQTVVRKNSKLGLVIAIAISLGVLMFFASLGALGGWPGLGLWVAGFVPVGYGVLQLFRKRPARGVSMLFAGLLAGLVGLGLLPTVPETPAEPGPTSVTSTPVAQTESVSTPGPSSLAPESTSPPKTAQEAVALLVVKGRGPATGFERGLFRWNSLDFDRNGCDQRNDVLKRDMTSPKIKSGSNGCRVEAGWLQDRYSGTAIYLTRDQVEIDHVVALSNAWVMGAAQWSPDQMVRFANDPLNLVATTQHLNRQKGDSNAASWLPPKGRCDYVARQVAVKQSYGLAITDAERDAVNGILKDCPSHPLPAEGASAPVQKSSTSPPPPKSATSSTPAAPKMTQPEAPKVTTPAKPKVTVPTKPKVTVPAKPTTTAPNPKVAKTTIPAEPKATSGGGGTDPQYRTCTEAKRHGYGPYVKGRHPEYNWYQDRDHDGVVCE